MTDQFAPYYSIIQMLGGFYTTADGRAYAKCPAHDDEHNSLSLRIGQQGQLLVKCHRGVGECGFPAIAKALNLDQTAFFPPRQGQRGPAVKQSVRGVYAYTDQEGELLYDAVRLQNPKGFYCQRPNPAGSSHPPIRNLDGVQLVPYNLPELTRRPKSEIRWIVEGEPKADLLMERGLLATCNAMGAEKWRVEWSPVFTDCAIAILPDNDEAGWRHAALVARMLAGTAGPIRFVELPGLKLKDDVVDFIRGLSPGPKERDRDILLAAYRSSPVFDPTGNYFERCAMFRMAVARAIGMSQIA